MWKFNRLEIVKIHSTNDWKSVKPCVTKASDVFKQYKAHYLTFFHSNLIRKPRMLFKHLTSFWILYLKCIKQDLCKKEYSCSRLSNRTEFSKNLFTWLNLTNKPVGNRLQTYKLNPIIKENGVAIWSQHIVEPPFAPYLQDVIEREPLLKTHAKVNSVEILLDIIWIKIFASQLMAEILENLALNECVKKFTSFVQ